MKRIFQLLMLALLVIPSVSNATVTASVSRIKAICNGSTTQFPFTFNASSTSEVEVVKTVSGVDNTLNVGTEYTTSCTNDDCSSGGTVTVVDTCETGSYITILRNVNVTQESDYTEGMPALYETFESDLDKQVRINQEQQEQLDRAFTLKKSDFSVVPEVERVAGGYLRWDSSGDDIESASVVNDSGSFLQSGTGAVSRTVSSKIGEFISVADYDNDLAVAVAAQGGDDVTLLVPDVTTIADGVTVTIPSTMTLWFINDGLIQGISGGGVETLAVNGSVICDIDGVFGDDLTVSGDYVYTNTLTIENIAALRLFAGNRGQQVSIGGYYSKGDYGGGLFYWDHTSVETDNGGTIIKVTSVTTGRWKRIYSLPLNVRFFGATGDGATDDTTSLVNAYATSQNLFFPQGTYVVTPVLRSPQPTGLGVDVYILWEGLSDTYISGEKGATIKLADDFSTDVSPKWLALFFFQDDIENVKIQNMEFDFNKANNPISPLRGSGTYNLNKHAIVWGWRAGCQNFTFDNNFTYDVNGVNCIVLAQPLNASDVITQKSVFITNNTFTNTGYDTNDHTCVISYQDQTVMSGNVFRNDTNAPGPSCAIELHGSQSSMTDNKIDGYNRAFIVGAHLERVISDIVVAHNSIDVRTQGGLVWLGSTQKSTNNVIIDHNNIYVAGESATGTASPYHSAIELYSAGSDATSKMSDVYILDNNVYFPDPAAGTVPFYGVQFTHTGVNDKMGNVKIAGNGFRYSTVGVNVSMNAQTGLLNDVEISGNKFIDMTSLRTGVGYGVYVSSYTGDNITLVDVIDNVFLYTGVGTGEYVKGVYFFHPINHINIDGNSFENLDGTVSNGTLNQITLSGSELTNDWAAAPTYGTWVRRDRVYNVNPSAAGTIGWVCVTGGSPGTWKSFGAITP